MTQIRTVMIPKDDGTDRPISVAAMAWRIGMSATVMKLESWIDEWAPAELVGGLPGRDARTVHEWLHDSLQSAMEGEANIAGAKLDVEKCFDTVNPHMAIHTLKQLGAPKEMCALC